MLSMRLNIRFKYWLLATTTALVLVLTSLFLLTVFGKFTRLAEENAQERFTLITQYATARIESLVKGVAQLVLMQGSSDPSVFTEGASINPDGLVSLFMTSLENDVNVYSHYFALGNDEFVQVIGVRSDSKIIASLKAPAGTHFAVRRIIQSEQRAEYWQFLDIHRGLLSERTTETAFVPSTRPWYQGAAKENQLFITAPYLFASTGEPGLTVSAPLPGASGVIAADIDLGDLSRFLGTLALTGNAAILILDNQNQVLAFHGNGSDYRGLNIPALTPIDSTDHPILRSLGSSPTGDLTKILNIETQGKQRQFIVTDQLSNPVLPVSFRIVSVAPLADFVGPVEQARKGVLMVTGAILLLLFPLSILGSRQVVNALAQLASNSERIKKLDLSFNPPSADSSLYEINTLSEAQIVMHNSIRERTLDLKLTQEKLTRLVDNGLLLSSERDRHKLLRHILFGAREIANCAACTMYLKTNDNTLSFALRTSDDILPDFEVPLYNPKTGAPMTGYVCSYAALNNETVIIDDVYREDRFDLSGTKRFSEQTGFRTVSMLTVPMAPRSDEVIGVLQLMNALDAETGAVIPFPKELVRFVEALAAQSAVALENHNLLAAQKELMDSMIKVIAGAIDAKSVYTGNHCKRVPELAVMLAEAAGEVREGALADFCFTTDDEWREFRIGAWLHDCGKVTTPEHVIDKATKLETIYNRIHEIRTRFEVLLRDARIDQLLAISSGVPEPDAEQRFLERRKQLISDFQFVAECNIGGEFMTQDRIDRLRKVGEQTWIRNFDNRLGLSHEELHRFESTPESTPESTLPATEHLLSDQPWHIVPRTDKRVLDPRYGFRIDVPEHLYDFGEIHNLLIARGTLTAEERFKINEHIIQTIIMLESMPFPKSMRRVPEYAGEHHETLLGEGYPRKKTPDQLSVPSRIMAIADIFEALTASDRPYKKAKTLSESVKLLASFRDREHIDAELFELFLTSGVYQRYAERFLAPWQLDAVDIHRYLSRPGNKTLSEDPEEE
jgi:HD-GYP domain-containing protein (c-di-GMP phosphodiesterase class II)